MKIHNTKSLKHNNYLTQSDINFIKLKLKNFLNFFFEFKKINSKIYFIGFPENNPTNYPLLFNKFQITSLKSEIWVNGLLSNSIYMNKYLNHSRVKFKLKKNKILFLKEFGSILSKDNKPDLIIFYENKIDLKNILKECHSLKIPVITVFDDFHYEEGLKNYTVLTIFNSNLSIKKEFFELFFYKVLKSLFYRENIYNTNNVKN